MTFGELWDLYRQHCVAENVHTKQSLAERDYTFGRFLAWKFEDTEIRDMKVGAAKKYMLRDFIASHPKWQSSSTRKAKANHINACLNWAVREERLSRNPFMGVTYAEAPPRPALEDECLTKILHKANKRFERFLLFLRLTGLRLSSAARVEWSHVIWDLQCIILPAELHKAGRRSGKPLTIALVAEAMELLKKIKVEDYHEGIIFRNNRGTPWCRGAVGVEMRRIKRRLGIECKATTHGIRHTVGSEGVRNGASIKAISTALGHGSSAITEKFYVHVANDIEMQRQALDASLTTRRR